MQSNGTPIPIPMGFADFEPGQWEPVLEGSVLLEIPEDYEELLS